MVNINLEDGVTTLKCIHNNEIEIELVINGNCWEYGAHIELNGCELCSKEIEEKLRTLHE